ncbi:MAG: CRISPR-associated endonuclease Cas1, partial [Pseudomonadota bacterium]|nr:CRISPR-associated endonuclease Cas1 [Pseudomonadota bacterium]
MNLILTSYGTYLHRSGEMFLIKVQDETREVSSRKVRSIQISTAASLSTDAIQLAVEKNSECRRAQDAKRDVPVPLSPSARRQPLCPGSPRSGATASALRA